MTDKPRNSAVLSAHDRPSATSLMAPICLVVGAILGIAGTFAPSAALRGVAWGVDGTLLVVGTALLALRHIRLSNDLASAGFIVFVAGQTLVVSCSALALEATTALFGAGAALWAAGLALVSLSRAMPMAINVVGGLASILFAVTALEIFSGSPLTPLTQPLPFFAFPFLALTLLGWAFTEGRR